MKLLTVWVAALVVVGASGCNDPSTPEGTLAIARDALTARDVPLFQSLLSGTAAEHFKEKRAVVELARKLDGRRLELTPPVWVKSEWTGEVGGDWQLWTYRLDVLEPSAMGAQSVVNVTTSCHARRVYCSKSNGSSNGHYACWRQTRCQISDFSNYSESLDAKGEGRE